MNPRQIIMRCWEYFVAMPRLLPLLVFGTTMLLTGLSTLAFERSERRTEQLRLQVKADEIAAALEQNMATNVAILRSGRALFAVLDTVDRATFERFVAELHIKGGNLGVRAVGWSAYVNVREIPTIEQHIRQQGQKDFHARPAPLPPTGMTHIILYLETVDGQTSQAMGFNMYTEPNRRAAMIQAAKTGLPVATGPLKLLVDANLAKPSGILVFVPVYHNNMMVSTESQGRQLKGFVYSSIRISDFVKAIKINKKELNASMKLFDVSGTSSALIYKTQDNIQSDYRVKQGVHVANRKWEIVLGAERSGYLSPLAALIFAFGVALSVLLGALTGLILLGGRNAQLALLARQEYETVRNVLTRELTHRVKNTLATVTSLAMLTRRGATSVESYADALTARLRALSSTHDLLTHRDWTSAPLRDVLEAEFAPYSKSSDVRLDLSGPEVMLRANIALSLGLAIHELVTNAAKYGAFSVPGGKVSISWALNPGGNTVRLEWQEMGGPRVQKPNIRGFGSDLVEKLMARELNSEVRIQFKTEGVCCVLNVPVFRAPVSPVIALKG
jgi:two-component sensor histidine kinase